MAKQHSHIKQAVIFCMHCGDILGADKHHTDCPTRRGLVWKHPKWVKANRTDDSVTHD